MNVIKYIAEIEVDNNTTSFIRKFLKRKDKDNDFSDVPLTVTGRFCNDIEIDVKLCNGDNSSPWVDVVCFEDGSERECHEPTDKFFDKFSFNIEGIEYSVIVKPFKK